MPEEHFEADLRQHQGGIWSAVVFRVVDGKRKEKRSAGGMMGGFFPGRESALNAAKRTAIQMRDGETETVRLDLDG